MNEIVSMLQQSLECGVFNLLDRVEVNADLFGIRKIVAVLSRYEFLMAYETS